jgi:steroid delta-isomerase-like uncharacterized protein
MSGDELKAKVIKFTEESWNKGNLDVMDEIFAKDVICHTPSVQDEKGLEAYKNRLTDTRMDYPDFKVTIDEIIVEGNTVADRWTCEATFSGPGKTMPIPGTGKKLVAKGTWVGHFVDGRIVEDWYTYDLLSWLQQAGILPVSEEQK